MEFKRFFDLDFALIIPVVILMIIGILFIYSSGVDSSGVSVANEYIKQIVWVSIGLVVFFLTALVDYRKFKDFSPWIFLIAMILLLYTVFFGKLVNGAKSWLGIGDFGIQPSEFAKIAFILFFSWFLIKSEKTDSDMSRFLKSLAILAVPLLLILAQPDLGTASVYIPVYLTMAFFANIKIRYLGMVLLFGIFTVVFMVLPIWQEYIYARQVPVLKILTDNNIRLVVIISLLVVTVLSLIGKIFTSKKIFYWISYFSGILTFSLIASMVNVLQDYQIKRLIVFLNPYVDPQGSGWNIIQSITAIGSGAIFGKGYLQGTQSHYRYLPQQSTDFIFSILSEEWGFVGGLVVFLLYAFILYRCINTMRHTRELYGFYIIAGVSSMIFFHFVVNVGMAMGIMPITGIPLLFLSYGGSSLLTVLMALGLVLSINSRRMDHI
ncbi:MAG: rod shape-determining protein RodA [Spirochaetes bacterium]|uniref:Peptidoglycan glycosyltransferase RodA n=1 Tax=Candidatus Gallitreponema excrementavium TaxID=2840840 RepID=A0A9D9HRC7_9SPIR|nr:rod shape-determining protein RodA [Candidatus Gallitreponema excrementavium]